MSEFKLPDLPIPRWECPNKHNSIMHLPAGPYCQICFYDFISKNVSKMVEITE
jgi:hypothetical protein